VVPLSHPAWLSVDTGHRWLLQLHALMLFSLVQKSIFRELPIAIAIGNRFVMRILRAFFSPL
jgi:hypothetical protein